jgi:CHAT domain-containing protein
VGGLFDGPVEQLIGETATVDRVIAGMAEASHVHFACHGQYDPDEPLDSHITLAEGTRLTLRQVLAQPVLRGVRLVTTAVCESAATDTLRLPDEAIGLPSGLVEGGAAAVVGCLRPVADRTAAVLMTRFAYLMASGLSPAAALTQAQVWLRDATARDIDDFSDLVRLRRPRASTTGAVRGPYTDRPGQWASFVLIGDGGPD